MGARQIFAASEQIHDSHSGRWAAMPDARHVWQTSSQRGGKRLRCQHPCEEGRMNEEMDRTEQALSEEVLNGMKEWRLAHPKATLREIEQAVEERVNQLRARMLQDVALASAASDWTQDTEAQRPVCPECGTQLQARGP